MIRELLDQLKPLDLELWKNIQHFYFVQEMAEEVEYDGNEFGHREKLTVPNEWLEYIICGETSQRCKDRNWFLTDKIVPDAILENHYWESRIMIRSGRELNSGPRHSKAESMLLAYLDTYRYGDEW